MIYKGIYYGIGKWDVIKVEKIEDDGCFYFENINIVKSKMFGYELDYLILKNKKDSYNSGKYW